jgi:hypothetical protein
MERLDRSAGAREAKQGNRDADGREVRGRGRVLRPAPGGGDHDRRPDDPGGGVARPPVGPSNQKVGPRLIVQ